MVRSSLLAAIIGLLITTLSTAVGTGPLELLNDRSHKVELAL